jgi:hypothetical protein
MHDITQPQANALDDRNGEPLPPILVQDRAVRGLTLFAANANSSTVLNFGETTYVSPNAPSVRDVVRCSIFL